MIQLLVMLIIGLSLLAFALFALVRAVGTNDRSSVASDFDLSTMLPLASLEFDTPALLFADTDYRVLISDPRLRTIARELRKDRRAIALLWLRELQRDVISMWRFRRFLTSRGASNAAGPELWAVFQSVGLISVLAVMRASVWLWGPYVFKSVVVGIRDDARKLRRSCVRALERLPREKWARVAAEWRGVEAAL